MNKLLLFIFLLFAQLTSLAQSELTKNGITVSVNLDTFESNTQISIRIKNNSKDDVFIPKSDLNKASYKSLDEVLIDFTVNYSDPLLYKDHKIPLYHLKTGQFIEFYKKHETPVDSIELVDVVLEKFNPNQFDRSTPKRVKKQFYKSLRKENPCISILHYVERRSYESDRFTFLF